MPVNPVETGGKVGPIRFGEILKLEFNEFCLSRSFTLSPPTYHLFLTLNKPFLLNMYLQKQSQRLFLFQINKNPLNSLRESSN